MITESSPESPPLIPLKNLQPRTVTTLLPQIVACVLLAMVQILWGRYQFGVGNQGIQISFLETLHDHSLFPKDEMVRTTLSQYPSWFFVLFSHFLSFTDVPHLYLWLHILVTAGIFLAIAALSRSLFNNDWAALVAMLLLVAGQHHALAGEFLYSQGFTHTWAVFPLTLLALVLFYRERYWAAFALAGAIFNLHALEAGYLVLLFGFVCLCQVRQIGWPKLLGFAGVFLLAAAPTVTMMLHQSLQHNGPGFDAEWMQNMHIRSADHSFPSSWWKVGDTDIPVFVSIIGLAAIALGLGQRTPQRRKTMLMAVAVLIIFAIGYVFTDIWPVAIVIRAQFFRSSRFLMIIAIAVIAYGCVRGWTLPWQRPAGMKAWHAWMEFLAATLTAAAVGIPSMMPLLPIALAVGTLIALLNGRLSWYQAMVAGIALSVCLLAWQRLQFVIPGLTTGAARSLLEFRGPPSPGWLMLIVAVGLWIFSQVRLKKGVVPAITGAGAIFAVVMVVTCGKTLLAQPPADADWMDMQKWAKENTPKNALFITPPDRDGFRIFSQRSIVGERRDGTQLYFSAAFSADWWGRMKALQPNIILTADGRDVADWGKPLGQMDTEQLIALGKDKYNADYIILPASASCRLEPAYANKSWVAYFPRKASDVPIAGEDPLARQRQFMERVVVPNIEANRMSNARVQIRDASGAAVTGIHYSLAQKSSAFGFGVSLPFFKESPVDIHGDYKAPPVTPAQLAQVPALFNYSVIPFSGQWRFMEPVEGQKDFSDLDLYIDWCAKNNVRTEFSFLTGYQPQWLKVKTNVDQGKRYVTHADELMKRYGDRIDSWEVVAEGIGLEQSAAAFAAMRKASPKIQLGIADDAKFWSPREGPAKVADMQRGIEDIRWLKSHNTPVDFFSMYASRPTGLWADGHAIYDTLDAFAKEGVRIHITQFGVPLGERIEGPLHHEVWTPELQAKYYEEFFTICYSHPAVDVVNIYALGPKSWLDGEGVLDDKDMPTAAYLALKQLITERWHTNVSGTFHVDGAVSFKGFQGTYDLTLTLANGQTIVAPVSVLPGQQNQYHFVLDAHAGTLTEERR